MAAWKTPLRPPLYAAQTRRAYRCCDTGSDGQNADFYRLCGNPFAGLSMHHRWRPQQSGPCGYCSNGLEEIAPTRMHGFPPNGQKAYAAERSSQLAAKPCSGPANGLSQGGSRSLKWMLRAEGMRATFDERQLRLAGLRVAV
jgi:hypothetical protein